jgi:hypothetical protein
MTPQHFVDDLRAALPERLRAVVLFGSAAVGDFVDDASDYDVLVVVDALAAGDLRALSPAFTHWTKRGNRLPLLMTSDELRASADAFPIEWLDMLQARQVLFGPDPVAGFHIDPACLRLHLERELKGKFLDLRERYILTDGRSKLVVELLTESLSTFLVLFRAALRLYQPHVPHPKLEALHALASHIPFDPQPFLHVQELKARQRRADDVALHTLFADYLAAIETVVTAIDRHIHAQK